MLRPLAAFALVAILAPALAAQSGVAGPTIDVQVAEAKLSVTPGEAFPVGPSESPLTATVAPLPHRVHGVLGLLVTAPRAHQVYGDEDFPATVHVDHPEQPSLTFWLFDRDDALGGASFDTAEALDYLVSRTEVEWSDMELVLEEVAVEGKAPRPAGVATALWRRFDYAFEGETWRFEAIAFPFGDREVVLSSDAPLSDETARVGLVRQVVKSLRQDTGAKMAHPDFELVVGAQRFELADGGTAKVSVGGAEIPVTVSWRPNVQWTSQGLTFEFPREFTVTEDPEGGYLSIYVEDTSSILLTINAYGREVPIEPLFKKTLAETKLWQRDVTRVVKPRRPACKRDIMGAEREGEYFLTDSDYGSGRVEVYALAVGKQGVSIILQADDEDWVRGDRMARQVLGSLRPLGEKK